MISQSMFNPKFPHGEGPCNRNYLIPNFIYSVNISYLTNF